MDSKTPRILIVDDDPDLLLTMSDILKVRGFEPVAVQTKKAALSQVERQSFDVALIDLRLGDGSGLDVLSEIKERLPETEGILLTGHATQDSAIQAIRMNAFGYFQKPFDLEQVLLSIRRAVEKCQSARDLRESEESFKGYFNMGAVGMCVTSPEKGWIEVNDYLCNMLGYLRDELILIPWDRLTHPDDLASDVELFEGVLAGRRDSYELDKRFIRKDGRVIYTSLYVTCRRNPDGTVRHFLACLANITDRKLAEEKIRESEERFRSLSASFDDMVFTLDKDQRHSGLYGEWVAKSGFTPEFFLGRTPRDVYGTELAAVHEEANICALNGDVVTYEWSIPAAGGDIIHYQTVVSPLRNSQGETVGVVGVGRDITKLKQAEEKNRTLTIALESAANGIVITSRDGSIEWINPAWSALTGYAKEEAIGKNPRLLKSGKQSSEFYRGMWETILAGKVWRGELVNRRKDGTLYYEEEMIAPVLDESDAVRNFIAIKQDITVRKQAEDALARTNLRLQGLRLIDHALLGVSVKGRAADLEALRHLLSLIPCSNIAIIALDEILDLARITARATGRKISVSLADETVSINDLRLKGLREGEIVVMKLTDEKSNLFEKQLYDSGGRSLIKSPLVVQGRLIGILLLSSGEPGFFTDEHLEIIRDVSVQLALSLHHENLLSEIRRHAEQLEKRVQERTTEIEATRRRLELAVNAGEIGVWEFNLKENKLLWNERMYLIHGMDLNDPDEIDSGVWWKTIHPQNLGQLRKQFDEAVKITGLFINEYRISRPDDSTRYVATNAIVLYDSEHKPDRMIGVTVDVTERKEVEDAMRRANLEMERALRIKDEFLANMSHELRTPLNAIMGISESLLEQTIGSLNEKQRKYISTINESGIHLLSVINDILDLSKIEAGRLELVISDVLVKSLFESSFRMVKEMAQKKSITISFEADENVQNVRGDPRRLLQILVNLLSNAVKFTPAGGRAGVQVTAHPDLNEVRFTVWDSGIGISEENILRLFQPFVQLDSSLSRASSGTGLGLMLVMEMTHMHGGNISVQSTPGKGSRFTISLPWSPEQGNPVTVMTVDKAESLPSLEAVYTGTVMLVEDTESVILLVKDYLQARGHRVLVARDGITGLKAASDNHPDLILLDIQMPGMDGFDVVEKLRANDLLKNTPVIALTALAMPGDRERCLAAGMNDYISKPIHLRRLAGIIESHLRRLKVQDKGQENGE
jgi:PAS domain S-box-containing protein